MNAPTLLPLRLSHISVHSSHPFDLRPGGMSITCSVCGCAVEVREDRSIVARQYRDGCWQDVTGRTRCDQRTEMTT